MKKCLTTSEERKEKQATIDYLFDEMLKRLTRLDCKPDNLCYAYMEVIKSIQEQICENDVIEKTHDFLDTWKIGADAMIWPFSFFSGMTQDGRNQVIKAYRSGEFDRHKGQNS